MSNSWITPSRVTAATLILVKNKLVAARCVNMEFVDEFKKSGDTVTIRNPVQFLTTTGANVSSNYQDINEPSVTLVIGDLVNVAFKIITRDLTLSVEKLSERYFNNAANQLAHKLDTDILLEGKKSYWNVGTHGTSSTSVQDIFTAKSVMDQVAIPDDDRCLILEPKAFNSIGYAQLALFTPSANGNMLNNASLCNQGAFGSGIYMSQDVARFTSGTANATGGSVSGAAQTGATVNLAGMGNALTVVAGDIITLAGCNAVNPRTKVDLGFLQPFVVTALNTSSAGGAMTAVPISPAIVTSGPYQNVTASPTDTGAVVKVTGQTAVGSCSLAMHRDAISLAVIPLEMPLGTAYGARVTDPQTGLSIRMIASYDIDSDYMKIRFDILYGVKAIRPDLMVRFMGK